MDGFAAPLDLLADGHRLRSQMRELLAGWSVHRIASLEGEYDASIWRALLETVWPKVASADDVRVVAEEVGAARCPLPLQSGLVQPAALLAAFGDPAGALAQLRSGQRHYTVGLHDAAGRPILSTPSVVAEARQGGGWQLSGQLRHVLSADSADVILTPVRIGTAQPAAIAAVSLRKRGLSATRYLAMDGASLSDLDLVDVVVPVENLFGVESSASIGSRALAMALCFGLLARSAELTGLAAGLLQLTVARVQSRQAFGQPLAALPTIQQRAADMYLDVTAARDATAEAAALLDADHHSGGTWSELDANLRLILSAAHVMVTQSALRVAAGAHQLCGGWGQLADAGLHHYTRAIKTAENQLGSVRFHRALIAAELAAQL